MRALVGENWTAWRAQWGKLGNTLLDTLFPPRCAGCGESGSLWCSACQTEVHLVRDPVCSRCGRPQSDAQHPADEHPCPQCRQFPLEMSGIRSAVMFEGPVRQAIHHLKYNGRTSLAEPLGVYLSARWRAGPLPADMIVPVPLHSSRLRERGYNQSTLLARPLSRASGLPLVESALKRVRVTSPQVTLNAAERKANVHAAFEASQDRVRGRRVLLIDDVCTTGATLASCSAALQRVGVESVWAMTLARAP